MGKQTGETSTAGKIAFIESHKPALHSGAYTICVTQKVSLQAKPFESMQRHFSVLGPRYSLDPQEIQAVFPPAGSLGDHSHVLPHIMLRRSTLPWERSGSRDGDAVPWLTLLLFDQEEIKDLEEKPPGTLQELNPKWESAKEPGEAADDAMTVIGVRKSLLETIMPTASELKLLTHVRQADDSQGEQREFAVIIGSRLPMTATMSIVHLVSVEGCYLNGKFEPENGRVATQGGVEFVRLVSLKSWQFSCVSAKQSFKGLLMHLNCPLLFSEEVADTTSNPILPRTTADQIQIPAELQKAFRENGHVLSGLTLAGDSIRWVVKDRSRSYLVSDRNNVYNAGGDLLIERLPPPLQGGDPKSLQAYLNTIKGELKTRRHPVGDDAKITLQKAPDHWWLSDQGKRYLLRLEGGGGDAQASGRLCVYQQAAVRSATLRIPPLQCDGAVGAYVETSLSMGRVPLPHVMRQGSRTVSWYRGPLAPGENKATDVSLPARSSDLLVRFNAENGMLDVSYAAAWELGRMLAPQSKRFSLDLFHWKRAHAQEQKSAEQAIFEHLPSSKSSRNSSLENPPESVRLWFEQLSLLFGLPFNYLVPDERMLPQESIRFFQIDPLWVECLMDGAFSIGRVSRHEHERDRSRQASLAATPIEIVSGILLRSDIVAGWPDLLVDGHGQDPGDPPSLLRMERLSKNVLICLFIGKLHAVDFHQRAEALHFGVDRAKSVGQFEKRLRTPEGDYLKGADVLVEGRLHPDESGAVCLDVDVKPGGVISIQDYAAQLSKVKRSNGDQLFRTLTSAQIAMQMIEGVERVRFAIQAKP